MISLSVMFDDTASGRIENMFLMYRIKMQIIILALDACLQSKEIDCVDARVLAVTIVESFKEGFCLTDNKDSNFEEVLNYVGVLFASGIVKRNGDIVYFEAPRDEIITLCSNARNEVKKHFVGGMERFDERLEIFVDDYKSFKKMLAQVKMKMQLNQLKKEAEKSEMH